MNWRWLSIAVHFFNVKVEFAFGYWVFCNCDNLSISTPLDTNTLCAFMAGIDQNPSKSSFKKKAKRLVWNQRKISPLDNKILGEDCQRESLLYSTNICTTRKIDNYSGLRHTVSSPYLKMERSCFSVCWSFRFWIRRRNFNRWSKKKNLNR